MDNDITRADLELRQAAQRMMNNAWRDENGTFRIPGYELHKLIHALAAAKEAARMVSAATKG